MEALHIIAIDDFNNPVEFGDSLPIHSTLHQKQNAFGEVTRKFSLVYGHHDIKINEQSWTLILGPAYNPPSPDPPYSHQKLWGTYTRRRPPHEIRKGGKIFFSQESTNSPWVACFEEDPEYAFFEGESNWSYDPLLLQHTYQIAIWLGMRVEFNWRALIVPSQREIPNIT
jgi:hypothetical protein